MQKFDEIEDLELEKMSAIYDGEELPEGRLQSDAFAKSRSHMHNWSMIGAALRNEDFAAADTSFADKIAAEIAAMEPPVQVDQNTVEQKPKINYVLRVRRAFALLGQVAAAAAIAAITVVGFQTYNAGSVADLVEPAANSTLGPVGGVNLASYQNDGQGTVIHMNQYPATAEKVAVDQQDPKALRELRDREFEKINLFLRGYVLDTAAN